MCLQTEILLTALVCSKHPYLLTFMSYFWHVHLRSTARFGRFPHTVTFSSQAALTCGVITCMPLILNNFQSYESWIHVFLWMNETIRRQKLIPAAKFLQTLTRDSEMIKILCENFSFLSCMGSEQWHGILNTYLLLLYSSAVILRLEDLHEGFTYFFYDLCHFQEFGLKCCMTSLPAGPFSSAEVSFLSGLLFRVQIGGLAVHSCPC